MASPTISPTAFQGSLSAFLPMRGDFWVKNFPATGFLSARVAIDDAASVNVRVTRIVVNQVVTVTFTPDDPVPPGVPRPPTQTEETMVVVREGDGSAPLLVEAGNIVKVEITASELRPGIAHATAALVVSGDKWDDVSASLTFEPAADVSTRYATETLSGRQGSVAVTTIVARHVSGPALAVSYELKRDAAADRIQLDEVRLLLAPEESKQARLIFRIRPDCPVGRKFITVSRNGGSHFDMENTLQLDVAPGS